MTNNARGTPSVVAAEPKRHSFLVDVLIRLVREKPLGTVGAVIVLVLFLTGIFADLLAPYTMGEVHLRDMFSPPSLKYLLGTDHLGRDLLSQLIYGARISMIIGVCACSLNVMVGTIIGSVSGFVGGKLDIVVQRFVDAWMSLPLLLIVLTAMTIVGKGMPQVIIIIGLSGGINTSRVIRSAVIAIKENPYVEAAVAVGCSTGKLLIRHILPNILAAVIIMFTVSMSGAILLEATISFLGFGVPPGTPSWGSILSMEGRKYMEAAPQLALWPGLCLGIVVYGANMLGDAIRDLLDPRLRGGVGRYGKTKKREKLESRLKKAGIH